jgi:hypothetical protein
VGLATAEGLAEIASGVLVTADQRRRRGSRRQAVERLGERRRLRAWSGPARGRPAAFCAEDLPRPTKSPLPSSGPQRGEPAVLAGRFLIRLSDSVFLAPQSDEEKTKNVGLAGQRHFCAEDLGTNPLYPAAHLNAGNQLRWPLLEWREETHSLRCRPAQSAALHCSESLTSEPLHAARLLS